MTKVGTRREPTEYHPHADLNDIEGAIGSLASDSPPPDDAPTDVP